MDIIVKKVNDLTPSEYAACAKANYGWGGHMQEDLREARRCPSDDLVIMLREGDPDDMKSLLGWCLVSPASTYGWYAAPETARHVVQFWVKKQYRRKGYGGILMSEVKKIDYEPHVIPHNKASGEFFSSYNLTTPEDSHAQRWLNPNKPRKA